ncbi:DUF6646 family protein [Croceivirga thetidis]|uniref:Outer membrane protein beta-barrel domain-containing protein n=1 Tax=Croceivirga thetidis TaxID=2721623 RepID=A0ABX1GRG2_9FLAO|nr:DUF6646 family protein [Croceivirga thetidis]NKI31515.1 hypothetical protein [Croceivirga thetidis]
MKIYGGILLIILSFSGVLAQEGYTGRGDNKFQVGWGIQKNGNGVRASYDYGLGENISVGVLATYVTGVDENFGAQLADRFDAKARFNANLGSLFDVDRAFDVYPGLSVGLKNFGGHIGARWFFSRGFGIYAEVDVPLAKYQTVPAEPADNLNNQVVGTIGASFHF